MVAPCFGINFLGMLLGGGLKKLQDVSHRTHSFHSSSSNHSQTLTRCGQTSPGIGSAGIAAPPRYDEIAQMVTPMSVFDHYLRPAGIIEVAPE